MFNKLTRGSDKNIQTKSHSNISVFKHFSSRYSGSFLLYFIFTYVEDSKLVLIVVLNSRGCCLQVLWDS